MERHRVAPFETLNKVLQQVRSGNAPALTAVEKIKEISETHGIAVSDMFIYDATTDVGATLRYQHKRFKEVYGYLDDVTRENVALRAVIETRLGKAVLSQVAQSVKEQELAEFKSLITEKFMQDRAAGFPPKLVKQVADHLDCGRQVLQAMVNGTIPICRSILVALRAMPAVNTIPRQSDHSATQKLSPCLPVRSTSSTTSLAVIDQTASTCAVRQDRQRELACMIFGGEKTRRIIASGWPGANGVKDDYVGKFTSGSRPNFEIPIATGTEQTDWFELWELSTGTLCPDGSRAWKTSLCRYFTDIRLKIGLDPNPMIRGHAQSLARLAQLRADYHEKYPSGHRLRK